MNRTEFTAAVAAELGTTKTEATRVVAAVLDTIQNSLVKGEDVKLYPFGGFKVRQRIHGGKRSGNQWVGDTVVKFNLSSSLRQALNPEKS